MFEAQNKQLTLQDKFDLAKKLSEGGTANTGFCIDGQVYNAYLTNDEWSDFVKTMPTEIANFFDNGQSGDMRERKTCFGNYIPPKMSSYGSSSRMLYELAKDIPDFIFKYKMPAIIGGKAHLDGYLKKGNIYMDAKCREIYGGQGDVKNVYDPYYAYLFRKTLLRYFRYGKQVKFYWGIKEVMYLNLKQILCHFLCIANYHLCNGIAPVNFIYLVYEPTTALLSYLTKEESSKIQEIWNQDKQEAESIDFKRLYRIAALFLHEEQGIAPNITTEQIAEMSESFTFTFCTQHDFIDNINRLSNGTI